MSSSAPRSEFIPTESTSPAALSLESPGRAISENQVATQQLSGPFPMESSGPASVPYQPQYPQPWGAYILMPGAAQKHPASKLAFISLVVAVGAALLIGGPFVLSFLPFGDSLARSISNIQYLILLWAALGVGTLALLLGLVALIQIHRSKDMMPERRLAAAFGLMGGAITAIEAIFLIAFILNLLPHS